MTHSWIAATGTWVYTGAMFGLRKMNERRTPTQQVWWRESWRRVHSKPVQAVELLAFVSGWGLLVLTDHWAFGLLCLAASIALLGMMEFRRHRLVGDGRLISEQS